MLINLSLILGCNIVWNLFQTKTYGKTELTNLAFSMRIRKILLTTFKVKKTVQCVIEEFFLTNPDILLYQCETGDNRQAMRARLFTKWFQEYTFHDRFYVKVSVLKDEESDNYIALIVQKNNPSLDSIKQTFDNFIGFFSQKPK